MKKIIISILTVVTLFSATSCMEDFMDVFPNDKITTANFPTDEKDVKMFLNGAYKCMKDSRIYYQCYFGFDYTDCCTPNGYYWDERQTTGKISIGTLDSSGGGIINYRWATSYEIISRVNTLLSSIDKIEMPEENKKVYIGEAHFLRGIAYSMLAEMFGGVPIILEPITPKEAAELERTTAEETWQQAIDDYDVAIANLAVDAPEIGRATKGAALGMKMRAYLYQGKYKEVITCVDQIDALKKYRLFPSYEGLFKLANENNEEVLFDIQYMRGENGQGSYLDQSFTVYIPGGTFGGSRSLPTENLVAAYETLDGSPVDPEHPYENRDPRLGFTVLLPGSTIYGGVKFPDVFYPGGAWTSPSSLLKHLAVRKYRALEWADRAPKGQTEINDIVLRYADVLLSKAEALVETGGSIAEAMSILNRIRTERDDVKMYELPLDVSREKARELVRHERRIELAMEGRYWSDVRRWHIGKDIYPCEVVNHKGEVIQVKFPEGYTDKYDLMPIPEAELKLAPKMTQNPGW